MTQRPPAFQWRTLSEYQETAGDKQKALKVGDGGEDSERKVKDWAEGDLEVRTQG